MTDYIRRNDALEIIKRTCGDYTAAWSEIRKLPTADVAEVRHGRWIYYDDDGVFTCSECGNAESNDSYYCRLCGAKMDEPDEPEN